MIYPITTFSQPAESEATQASEVQPSEKVEIEVNSGPDSLACVQMVMDTKINSVGKDFHVNLVVPPI